MYSSLNVTLCGSITYWREVYQQPVGNLILAGCNRVLEPLEQLGQAQIESIGNGPKNPQARVLLARFNLRQVASIDAESLSQIHLGPVILSAQSAHTASKANANVCGHS
jgi:hypothetical protein